MHNELETRLLRRGSGSGFYFPQGLPPLSEFLTLHAPARRGGRETKEDIQVTIAQGLHLFPFRTEKLNLVTPMVLRKRESR